MSKTYEVEKDLNGEPSTSVQLLTSVDTITHLSNGFILFDGVNRLPILINKTKIIHIKEVPNS